MIHPRITIGNLLIFDRIVKAWAVEAVIFTEPRDTKGGPAKSFLAKKVKLLAFTSFLCSGLKQENLAGPSFRMQRTLSETSCTKCT